MQNWRVQWFIESVATGRTNVLFQIAFNVFGKGIGIGRNRNVLAETGDSGGGNDWENACQNTN